MFKNLFKNSRRKKSLKDFYTVVSNSFYTVSNRRKGKLSSIDRAKVSILLVENPDFVNEQFENGQTALHYTVNADIAKLLIERGANVNTKSSNGLTPLDVTIAIFLEVPEVRDVVDVLLENGAKCTATTIERLIKAKKVELLDIVSKRLENNESELGQSKGRVRINKSKEELILHLLEMLSLQRTLDQQHLPSSEDIANWTSKMEQMDESELKSFLNRIPELKSILK